MTVSIIAAMAKDNAIGRNNALLWHIPEDLRRFRRITTGHTVIMGRRTFESLGRPLPDRRNIVISRTMSGTGGIETAHSLDEALSLCSAEEEVFVIGGGQIYMLAMEKADRIYLTIVDSTAEADTYFPDIDCRLWRTVFREDHPEGGFSFITLERRQD